VARQRNAPRAKNELYQAINRPCLPARLRHRWPEPVRRAAAPPQVAASRPARVRVRPERPCRRPVPPGFRTWPERPWASRP